MPRVDFTVRPDYTVRSDLTVRSDSELGLDVFALVQPVLLAPPVQPVVALPEAGEVLLPAQLQTPLAAPLKLLLRVEVYIVQELLHCPRLVLALALAQP